MHILQPSSLLGASAALLMAGAALLPTPVQAGGHDNWATTGKILTGVVGYQILSGMAHGYRDRETVVYHDYYYRPTYVPPPTVIYREAPQVVYYESPAPVSVYRPAPAPQVVYVQQQPAPAPQVVYVQQPAAPAPQVVVQQPAPAAQPAPAEAAPPPVPAQEKPVAAVQPAPAAAVLPVATAAAMPATGDVDPNQYVVANLEEGKRLIQPRQHGRPATLQQYSDVKKEWVDIKSYPSIW